MARNELVLLDQLLQARAADDKRQLSPDQLFERFAVEQVLRDDDISGDDIEAGIVAGGGDGGLDGVYVFLGGQLLAEDSEVLDEGFSPSRVGVGTQLSLVLVQAKTEESFSETAIDLADSSTKRVLDLAESDESLRKLYNDAVVDRVGIFTGALKILAVRHPTVDIRFYYVSRGDSSTVNEKVRTKAGQLEQQFRELVPDAEGAVAFVGAAELWRLASTPLSYTLEMEYQENATSSSSHVALVSLADYYEFLTGADGRLRRHIFDWNVRDFQGAIEVNREIRESLESAAAPQFWWLNNGVTIICSKASSVGKKYILDDVQVVNGLQTSHTIYQVLSGQAPADRPRDRLILVRILVTDDPGARDRVIRATNRQTAVSEASLRATDQIQREIEAYFLTADLYYDRRKNYYRNLGKAPDRIIGIPVLAQAVMAMGLSRPDNSRARPSSLLKRNDDYEQIFTRKVDLGVYLWAARSQKTVDAFLQSGAAAASAPERTNLRWHLAMLAAGKIAAHQIHAPAQLREIMDRPIEDGDLPARLKELRTWYVEHTASTGATQDRAAKSNEFVEFILKKQFGA